MCQRVNCPKCNKPTFKGCGQHVEQVLAGVPVEQRCACNAAPPKPVADEGAKRKGWWPFG